MDKLEDIGFTQEKPITIYEDKQSWIKIIENEKFNKRTKHIDIKFPAINQLKEGGIIELKYCTMKHMIADVLTKPVPKNTLEKHRISMELLVNSSEELKGECCNY